MIQFSFQTHAMKKNLQTSSAITASKAKVKKGKMKVSFVTDCHQIKQTDDQKENVESGPLVPKVERQSMKFGCQCGKTFETRNGLWRHHKKGCRISETLQGIKKISVELNSNGGQVDPD